MRDKTSKKFKILLCYLSGTGVPSLLVHISEDNKVLQQYSWLSVIVCIIVSCGWGVLIGKLILEIKRQSI